MSTRNHSCHFLTTIIVAFYTTFNAFIKFGFCSVPASNWHPQARSVLVSLREERFIFSVCTTRCGLPSKHFFLMRTNSFCSLCHLAKGKNDLMEPDNVHIAEAYGASIVTSMEHDKTGRYSYDPGRFFLPGAAITWFVLVVLVVQVWH